MPRYLFSRKANTAHWFSANMAQSRRCRRDNARRRTGRCGRGVRAGLQAAGGQDLQLVVAHLLRAVRPRSGRQQAVPRLLLLYFKVALSTVRSSPPVGASAAPHLHNHLLLRHLLRFFT